MGGSVARWGERGGEVEGVLKLLNEKLKGQILLKLGERRVRTMPFPHRQPEILAYIRKIPH